MYLKNSFIFILFMILSCQPVEILKPIEIDTSRFEKISINAEQIQVNNKYNSVFSKSNIEDQIKKSPINLMAEWNSQNILKLGSENKLVINILDASIKKTEIMNIGAKKCEERTIFNYELFYLVEYELYDSSSYLIANTTVETSRSTTSQKYISLNETEIIINDLLFLTLNDYINETKKQLSIYMGNYLSI